MVSSKLKALKAEWNLTYRQMADASGVSFSRMGPICRGTVRIYAEELTLICNLCFDLHTSDFYKDILEERDLALGENITSQFSYTDRLTGGIRRTTAEHII